MPNLNVGLDVATVILWGCGLPTMPPICRNISVLAVSPANLKGGVYEFLGVCFCDDVAVHGDGRYCID